MTVPAAHDMQAVTGTSVTVEFVGRNSDGEPADPGTVTVGVVNAAGVTVVAAGTATVAAGNTRSIVLAPAQTGSVDTLTATWTAGGVTVGSTVVELVSAPLITFAEFQSLSAQVSHNVTLDRFLLARRSVDDLLFDALNRSMVRRFTVERVDWRRRRGGLPLRYPDLESVRFARRLEPDGTTTDVLDVASIRPDTAGVAYHDSWLDGRLEIGYVHGWPAVPADAKRVVARLIRVHLGESTSALDDRAQAYTDSAGNTIRLGVEGRPGWWTAVPGVNEFIGRHRWAPEGVA